LDEAELATMRGTLWLPPTAEDRQRYGQWTVVAVGPDVMEESLLPGARVILRGWAGTIVELEGVSHTVVHETDVLAVIV
jgi:co-chaperonin GroES (HSP10)